MKLGTALLPALIAAVIAAEKDKRSPWYAAAVGRHIEALAQAGRWSETIVAVAAARVQFELRLRVRERHD